MKINLIIALFGIVFGLANISFAQTNYKNQFQKSCCVKDAKCCIEKAACCEENKVQASIKDCCTTGKACCEAKASCCNNYKAFHSTTTSIKKASDVPSCCTNIQTGLNADYKHSFSGKEKVSCDVGYVCKEDVKSSCCN